MMAGGGVGREDAALSAAAAAPTMAAVRDVFRAASSALLFLARRPRRHRAAG